MGSSATHGGWSGVAEAYAAHCAPLCVGAKDAVLHAAGVHEGDWRGLRILDVGTGTGALAKSASDLGAAVTAIDPDPEMLGLASKAAPEAQLLCAGLPDLPFDTGTFDVVFASFVINHVTDPLRGVVELARVTRTGGRVVMSIWPSGSSFQGQLWAKVLADCDAAPVSGVRLPSDKDFERTADGLAALLERAGLVDITSEVMRWQHTCEPDSLWLGAAAGVGGIGTTVTSQPARTRELMKAAYDRGVATSLRDGTLTFEAAAVVAAGTGICDVERAT